MIVDVLVLGEVQVWAADRRFDVGLPRQQAVLAALLVDGPRPVSVPTLIDRVWGDSPPDSARNVLYSHVSRIRRLLREVTEACGVITGRLERHSAGYVLNIDPETVDLHRFRRLVTSAGDSRLTEQERADTLCRALRLWRGLPLGGIPGDWAARLRESWQRQRLDATVAWADAELRLGRTAGIPATVPDLVAAHPLVEPLNAALIRALHHCGREAEALDP